jgi:hypothetical protein
MAETSKLSCTMSQTSKDRITGELREFVFQNKTQRGIRDLAILLNPKLVVGSSIMER